MPAPEPISAPISESSKKNICASFDHLIIVIAELARQHRNRRKRRQKWFWCSVGLLVTVGATAIAWSYLPVSRSSTTEGSATESREK